MVRLGLILPRQWIRYSTELRGEKRSNRDRLSTLTWHYLLWSLRRIRRQTSFRFLAPSARPKCALLPWDRFMRIAGTSLDVAPSLGGIPERVDTISGVCTRCAASKVAARPSFAMRRQLVCSHVASNRRGDSPQSSFWKTVNFTKTMFTKTMYVRV